MRKQAACSVADEDRCNRNDGRHWRCPFPRFGGKPYCEKHHLYQLQKSAKSRARVRVRVSAPSDATSARVSDPPEISEDKEDDDDDDDGARVLKLGEIWAFSEESSDGFPRSYARIDRIIPIPIGSLTRVTPLIPHPHSDEEKLFAEQGLRLACGLFEASDSCIVKEISSLTHKVLFEMEGNGSSLYRISPKKGEIWAVYLEWDGGNERFEYKLVEVASDFSEEDGVNVFGLDQVEGKSGVYRRYVSGGFYQVRCFSRGFMAMFSHRVPATTVMEDGEMFWEVMFH